jgi:hypothetical protein
MKNAFIRLCHRSHRNERGHVFLTALIILAVGGVILVPLLGFIGTGLNAGQTFEIKTGEIYAADAGIEDAIWQMLNSANSTIVDTTTAQDYGITLYGIPPHPPEDHDGNPGTDPITYDQSLYWLDDVNGNHVRVTIQHIDGGAYRVISHALDDQNEVLTTITAFVTTAHDSGGSGDGGSFTFNGAITGLGGGVLIGGDSLIMGDVFSGAALQLSGSSSIQGNAYAENFIQMGWSTSISGDAVTPGLILGANPNHTPDIGNPQPSGPNLDPSLLTQEQIDSALSAVLNETNFSPVPAGPVTHQGNQTFPPQRPPPSDEYTDPVHVSGKLGINNSTSITFLDTVHVDGDMTINASGKTIIFEGPVVVGGNLTLQNGDIIFRDSVYVANGKDLDLGGSATAAFEGPVRVGGDIDLGSSGDVSFDSTIYTGGDFSSRGDREVFLGDDIYISGDLAMNGSSKLVGGETVVVMGDVDLSGSTKIENVEDLPFILAPNGDFSMSGSNYVSAWVYAPEADIELSGNVKLYGASIAYAATVKGSSIIEFPSGEAHPIFIPGQQNGGGNGSGGSGSIYTVKIESFSIS